MVPGPLCSQSVAKLSWASSPPDREAGEDRCREQAEPTPRPGVVICTYCGLAMIEPLYAEPQTEFAWRLVRNDVSRRLALT